MTLTAEPLLTETTLRKTAQPTTEAFFTDYIQVAHRLLNMPGKCQNIHGHSMKVTLYITGTVDENGVLGGLDFGVVKKEFRNYLKLTYDHKLLLNENDPWAGDLFTQGQVGKVGDVFPYRLPGLQTVPSDPTTENIARWIFEYMAEDFNVTRVEIQETSTNGVVHVAA
jgi:6-pyruvoyltetrahydropterin/6-carboxytetrahydropterin synthase